MKALFSLVWQLILHPKFAWRLWRARSEVEHLAKTIYSALDESQLSDRQIVGSHRVQGDILAVKKAGGWRATDKPHAEPK